jgi:hypothetical protein
VASVPQSSACSLFLGTLLTYALFDGLLLAPHVARMPDARAIDALVENLMTVVSAVSQT